MTELLGRVGLAAFVLMAAAAVVTTTGSGGLGGRASGLFGFKSPTLAAPEEPVTLKPTTGPALVAVRDTRLNSVAVKRLGGERKSRRRDSPSPPRHRSPVSVQPAPSPGQPPAPAPVPIPVPKPSPGGGPGPTEEVAQVVRQAVQPVPPAQAPVEQVLETVNQVCAVAGVCPS